MSDQTNQTAPLKGAERNAFIYDLHLQEHTSRYIANLPEVQLTHVQVTRIINKIESDAQNGLVEFAKNTLLKDLKKLKMLERIAWECLRASKGTKSKTDTFTKGESEPSTRTTEWKDAGDPRWAKEARECIAERHRLLGTYRKPLEDLTDDEVEAVRFEQAVYIPGIGFLEPDVIVKLISQSGQADLWHALYALAQHQKPHQYQENTDDSP